MCDLLPPAYVVRGKVIFIHGNVCLFTFREWGGPMSQIFGGGVPCLRFFGGVPCLRFSEGGSHVSDFQRGGPMSQISGGGPRSQIFLGGGYPVSVKGKIFDTRFGLIHVQTGKKNFCRGTPFPPSKGKNFWHQIWLDTCSDRKKFFCRGTPPPSKGKIFWHQIWLDTCSDWEKIFWLRDPPPRIARNCYGHAASSMPLVFTQEDFLVYLCYPVIFLLIHSKSTGEVQPYYHPHPKDDGR